eukprot:TRINITY_DN43923_c0_g1_i1.p1 TRINITY_DN43923_c0_g1~~TRINITY_DN43923_c0_g1_i1.p1  ORF type:complete len:631 (+),score=116.07 TRINITY_DN43923_c0_g1_i1:102-1994(+)
MNDGLHVGTYIAEQVATTSYDLLAVTQTDFKRRAGSKQTNGGATGGSPGEGKLRRPKERGTFKATVLPALVSIDPLLQNAGQLAAVEEEKQRLLQQQEAQRKRRNENIKISSARLARGVAAWCDDRPLTDRPATRADVNAVVALTQPLPWFKEANSSTDNSFRSTSAGTGKSSKSKKRGGRTDPRELFKEGLRGTELENSPNAPHGYSHSPRALVKVPHSSREELRRLMSLSELPLLPEDPVETFFQEEEERKKKEQPKKDLAPKLGKTRMQNFLQSSKMTELRAEVKGQSDGDLTRNSAFIKSFADIVKNVQDTHVETRKSTFWNELLDALYPKQKISTQRREACQMMRIFVLGAVGNENVRAKRDKENVFYESIGSKEDMVKLCDAWDKIDVDNSGRVDMMELRSFGGRLMIDVVAANAWSSTVGVSGKTLEQVSGSGKSRLSGWLGVTPPEERAKFAQRLVERMGSVLISSRKSQFSLEDVMRLMWSCSSVDDLKQMRDWCNECNLTRDKYRVSTPPVLPPEEKSALQAVFTFFDKDGGGTLSVSELIMSGLMDRDYAKRFITEVDQDGSGEIDSSEFCEMMCPNGFRAHEDSETGSTPLGESVRFDQKTRTWRMKQAPPAHTPSHT